MSFCACAVCFHISAYAALLTDHKCHLSEMCILTSALLLSQTLRVMTVRGGGAVPLEEKLELPGARLFCLLKSQPDLQMDKQNSKTNFMSTVWSESTVVCNVLILYKYYKFQWKYTVLIYLQDFPEYNITFKRNHAFLLIFKIYF